MTTKSVARLTIGVSDRPSVIASLGLQRDGSLTIRMRTATFYRDPSDPSRDGAKIIEQRYSVHTSAKSAHGINDIVQTIVLDNGERIRKRHVTKAIKQTNAFAHIYSRRCPNLSDDRYRLTKESGQNVSLGSYDPTSFSLIYSIFVGHKDRAFKDTTHNAVQTIVGEFRVVALWCFFTMPSHWTSYLSHTTTVDPDTDGLPESLKTASEWMMAGFNESGCSQMFLFQLGKLRKEYLDTLRANHPTNREILHFSEHATTFLRVGHWDTPEYRQYMRRAISLGLFPLREPDKA